MLLYGAAKTTSPPFLCKGLLCHIRAVSAYLCLRTAEGSSLRQLSCTAACHASLLSPDVGFGSADHTMGQGVIPATLAVGLTIARHCAHWCTQVWNCWLWGGETPLRQLFQRTSLFRSPVRCGSLVLRSCGLGFGAAELFAAKLPARSRTAEFAVAQCRVLIHTTGRGSFGSPVFIFDIALFI